jgi:hypothetical protein
VFYDSICSAVFQVNFAVQFLLRFGDFAHAWEVFDELCVR